MSTSVPVMEPTILLGKDLKQAAATLGRMEARYLVDYYYSIQELRKASGNQVRAIQQGGTVEPHAVLQWIASNSERLEQNIAKALDRYSDAHVVGKWAKSIYGIGPVISAGLLAHIDLKPWRCRNKAAKKRCKAGEPCLPECDFEIIRTFGHILSFAGHIGPSHDYEGRTGPLVTWEKGQVRPWNTALRTLFWKIGDSFTKFSNADQCYYGHVYKQRKQYEMEQNEKLAYAAQAEGKLKQFKIGKGTEAYKHYSQGKLPPARIQLRAQRKAVRLFISHWHWVAYESTFNEPVPKPYVIEHLGHTDLLKPPGYTPLAQQ